MGSLQSGRSHSLLLWCQLHSKAALIPNYFTSDWTQTKAWQWDLLGFAYFLPLLRWLQFSRGFWCRSKGRSRVEHDAVRYPALVILLAVRKREKSQGKSLTAWFPMILNCFQHRGSGWSPSESFPWAVCCECVDLSQIGELPTFHRDFLQMTKFKWLRCSVYNSALPQ